MYKLSKIALIVLIASFSIAKSQFIEDALRYTHPKGIITPRAAAMNVSFYGISDDISALYYNPAGLTLIGKSELSFGFGFTTTENETDFISSKNLLRTNSENITHAGIAIPVQFEDTKAAIAIGYFNEDDYNSILNFSGFNPQMTLIRSEAEFGPQNRDNNWSYLLYLSDSVNNNFITPYNDSLQQSSITTESGGLHNVSGGVSFDVNEFVAIGFGITGKWGDYGYRKKYTESDNLNIHSGTSIEGRVFDHLTATENLKQNVSGINATIGIQGRLSNFLRFGVSVKTPTWYQVDETFDYKYEAFYKSGHQSEYYKFDGNSSYNLRTPFVYSAGLSIHGEGLTFAAGVSFSDATQLKFSDAVEDVMMLNDRMITELVGQTTWGFGLEYDIPMVPIVARASYERTTSPYQMDIANANITNISLGGGIYLGKKIRLDGVFRWINFSEQRANFDSPENLQQYSNFVVNRMPLNISFGLTYRY